MNNCSLYNKSIFLIKILFICLIFWTKSFGFENNKLKNITEGDENAKIKILVYESAAILLIAFSIVILRMRNSKILGLDKASKGEAL